MSGIIFGLMAAVTTLALKSLIPDGYTMVMAVSATSFVWGAVMSIFLAHSVFNKHLQKGTGTSVL